MIKDKPANRNCPHLLRLSGARAREQENYKRLQTLVFILFHSSVSRHCSVLSEISVCAPSLPAQQPQVCSHSQSSKGMQILSFRLHSSTCSCVVWWYSELLNYMISYMQPVVGVREVVWCLMENLFISSYVVNTRVCVCQTDSAPLTKHFLSEIKCRELENPDWKKPTNKKLWRHTMLTECKTVMLFIQTTCHSVNLTAPSSLHDTTWMTTSSWPCNRLASRLSLHT